MPAGLHRAAPVYARTPGGAAVLARPAPASQPPGNSHEHLLDLQREAGNSAVCQLLLHRGTDHPVAVQRAPATKATKVPKTPSSEFDDVADFLNGFQELAVAATTKGARAVYGPKLGPDLSNEHRAVLERVRRVLIKAQGDAAARKAARAEWPGLTVKLLAGVERGKKLGMPAKHLAATVDNIEAVGEHYVMAAKNTAGADVSSSSAVVFAEGVRRLVNVIDMAYYDLTSGVVPTNIDAVNLQQRTALSLVMAGTGLNPRHRELLEQLRKTFVLARTRGSAKQALALWKSISDDVFSAVDRAAPDTNVDVGQTRKTLADIGEKLIHGGAYNEAHNKARENLDLKGPKEAIEAENKALAEERLKLIAADVFAAKDLSDKAAQLSAAASMGAILKKAGLDDELGGALWDLAKNPGEVLAKLEDFKKRGVIGKFVTVADMADKMLALRNAAYSVSLTAIKTYATSQGKAAAAAGAKELVAKWSKVGDWASGKLELLGKVGKVAGVIGIAVSAVKVIDALANGDFTAAFQEAGSTALGIGGAAAAKLGGIGGGAMFAGIGVVIAAQMEGIAGAAAMIRYCRQANVREAALDFIHVCEAAADIEAKSLIADARILDDPDLVDQRDAIQQRLVGHLEWWNRHVGQMQALYENPRANALGGQPALRGSLGPLAIATLYSTPAPTWEGLGNQIRFVFAGANSMSSYVVKHYPRAA